MELSRRLRAVADLVGNGLVVADVGTDHGYIPIWLLENQRNPRAIALDIHTGPLMRAQAHIREHGLEEKIEVRRSDGVQAVSPGECGSIVIAGMGGPLTIKILEEGKAVAGCAQELVLQPQSEIANVRRYLWKNGYVVAAEDLILEDGKFYPMMKVRHGQDVPYSLAQLRYGRELLAKRHPVLKLYLEREIRLEEELLKKLRPGSGERIEQRRAQVQEALRLGREALRAFFQ